MKCRKCGAELDDGVCFAGNVEQKWCLMKNQRAY